MNDLLPTTPERWRDILDTALEHGSHAWAALDKAGLAHVRDKEHQTWPPQCTDDAGSAPYHMTAMIRYVFEVYSGIFSLYPDDAIEISDDQFAFDDACQDVLAAADELARKLRGLKPRGGRLWAIAATEAEKLSAWIAYAMTTVDDDTDLSK